MAAREARDGTCTRRIRASPLRDDGNEEGISDLKSFSARIFHVHNDFLLPVYNKGVPARPLILVYCFDSGSRAISARKAAMTAREEETARGREAAGGGWGAKKETVGERGGGEGRRILLLLPLSNEHGQTNR